GDDHVEAVVDAGASLGFFPPGVEGVAHLRAFGLDGEVDDAGGPAHGCGSRAGFEIVGGGGAAEGHVEMGVRVDASGEDEHSGGVDYAVGGFVGKGSDAVNFLVFYEDICFLRLVRVYDRSITDESFH